MVGTREAIREAFERDGIVAPLPAIGEAAAGGMLQRLEVLERREGGRLSASTNKKPHLLLPWIEDIVRHPVILDAVESALGPDLLCWSSMFFAKDGGDGGYVSWHQDATYWGLSDPAVATAWVALTESTPGNGCLRVVPGSHHRQQIPHRDTFDAANMLSRGQEIAVAVDESESRDVVLAPGEMSLHHVLLVHGSAPNRTAGRRVGLAIRYVPTWVRQTGGALDSAMLVRGKDTYGHFELEPSPRGDFHPDAVAYHSVVAARQRQIAMAGAQRPTARS